MQHLHFQTVLKVVACRHTSACSTPCPWWGWSLGCPAVLSGPTPLVCFASAQGRPCSLWWDKMVSVLCGELAAWWFGANPFPSLDLFYSHPQKMALWSVPLPGIVFMMLWICQLRRPTGQYNNRKWNSHTRPRLAVHAASIVTQGLSHRLQYQHPTSAYHSTSQPASC